MTDPEATVIIEGAAHSPPTLSLFAEPLETATPRAGKRPIAVIGAGFSGTIAVLHLLRQLPQDQPVLLCERAPEFARGVAYASGEFDHLLNVRATNMSALADEPWHFSDWLRQRMGQSPQGLHPTEAGLFASRGIYGQYLRTLLDTALRDTAADARLRLMPDDVTKVTPLGGGGYRLAFASGQGIEAAGIILAVGNLLPEEDPDPRICTNPWGEKAWKKLSGDQPVLLIGTGLTMVDLAVSLRRRGFAGRIIAMSRGGLLPTRHAAADPWPAPRFTASELSSLPLLMDRLRREVAAAGQHGVDWRAVIDSLRPFTAEIWSRLPLAERNRFLRHARRYWDVHRHRMAPPHADQIAAMQREGSLSVVAGRISKMEPTGNLVNVRYRLRGAANDQTLAVQRVIMASGLEPVARTRDPLVAGMLADGLARLDKHGLGLDVTPSLRVMRADGTPAERLWALGPIVRGVFWECIAVPDIRVQASQMAASVLAGLKADAPRWSYII
ncbi:MAG TPA: FAD/NAD(P)-binding protein [Acetobacteraceae bacterium]|nr:FAD/NAD(P)-binding protein [Acetobacteraceae bacterium]